MKQISLQLVPPVFERDNNASRQMSAMVTQLQDILQFIVDNLSVKVVASAPTVKEIDTIGDGKGNTLSEVVILDSDTQSSRRIYFKNKAGTLRYLESD